LNLLRQGVPNGNSTELGPIIDKKVWKRRGRNNVWSPTRQAPVAYGTFSTIPKQHRHSTIPSDSCNKWRGILGHKSLNSWKGPERIFQPSLPLEGHLSSAQKHGPLPSEEQSLLARDIGFDYPS